MPTPINELIILATVDIATIATSINRDYKLTEEALNVGLSTTVVDGVTTTRTIGLLNHNFVIMLDGDTGLNFSLSTIKLGKTLVTYTVTNINITSEGNAYPVQYNALACVIPGMDVVEADVILGNFAIFISELMRIA